MISSQVGIVVASATLFFQDVKDLVALARRAARKLAVRVALGMPTSSVRTSWRLSGSVRG